MAREPATRMGEDRAQRAAGWLEHVQERTGSGVREIAATLLAELNTALARVDAGLAAGELDAAAQAAHAARSSALLLEDAPLDDALRALEAAARALDPAAARGARERADSLWQPLRERLQRAARAAHG